MSDDIFDIVILGGGCATLNFAMAFAACDSDNTVMILEARPTYQHDRNWSFWLTKNQSFTHSDIVAKKWSSWRFSEGNQTVQHHSVDYDYATIQSGDFYQKAMDVVEHNDRIDLCMSCAVDQVEWNEVEKLHKVSTNQGPFKGRFIIDTRNLTPDEIKERVPYYQIFYGIEVETNEPTFDAECVGLMDNLKSDAQGTSFLYTLPFSETRALIEYTLFTDQFVDPSALEDRITSEARYKVVAREMAVLPMGQLKAKQTNTEQMISVGGHAGHLRESSGYGFLRMYDWAQSAVTALERNEPIPSFNQPSALDAFMDRHFVKTLKISPLAGANVFFSMARNTSADAFARFMSGDAGLLQYMKVIMSVPKWPFLKALVKS